MKITTFKIILFIFAFLALFLTLRTKEALAQACTGDSGASGTCTAPMACTPSAIDGLGTCTDPDICCLDLPTPIPGDGGTGDCSDACTTTADCLDIVGPPNGYCSPDGLCYDPNSCSLCTGDSGYPGTCTSDAFCDGTGKNSHDGYGSCTPGNVCCTNLPPSESCTLTVVPPTLVGAFFQVILLSDTPNTSYTVTTSPTCVGPTNVTTDAAGHASFTKDCGPPAGTYNITAQAGAVSCSTSASVTNDPGPACTGLGGASGYCVAIACPLGYIADGVYPDVCSIHDARCCVPEGSYTDFVNRDRFSDAQKVNEYVSWYLNGTIGRAEYPQLKSFNPEDITKITSFSGPLNKRLPLAYIDQMKIKAIENASTNNPSTNLPENHNQIVVCANEGFLGLGSAVQHPCYQTPGQPASDVFRLKDWNGDLSDLSGWLNWGIGTDFWNKRIPPVPWGNDQRGNPMTPLTYRRYYNEWRGNSCVLIPLINALFCFDNPLIENKWADLFPFVPLANTTDKDAPHSVSGIQMQPNAGTVACFSGDTTSCANPVPPDRQPDPPANNSQLNGSNPDIVHEPQLFYPHTLEDLQLSDMLNKVFTPTDCHLDPADPYGGCIGYENPASGPQPRDYENLGCSIVETRSNPGDNLFQGSQDSRIDDLAVYVDIQIEKIGCPAGPIDSWIADCGCNYPSDCPTRSGCELTSVCLSRNSDLNLDGTPYTDNDCINPNSPDPLDCSGTYPDRCSQYPTCSGSISLRIPSTPEIPYAKDIWKSTVVNRETTFRRIFPKIEEGAPVSCIADITGTTSTQYAPLPNPGYTPLVSVDTPLATNVPSGPNGVISSELYFPYQGTVYEYFLKGIQTALRPKGYGSPIPNGTECNVVCGDLPDFGDTGDCSLLSGTINGIQIPDNLAKILEAAGYAYDVPPSLIVGLLYGEGAFNQPPGNATGRGYDWTDDNVLNWASCDGLPGCTDETSTIVGFLPGGFQNSVQAYHVLDKLKEFDPTITEVDPCNLWHVLFAIAAMIRSGAGGNPGPGGISGESCYGIQMGSYIPQNCSEWYQAGRGDSMMETAIRVWEFGTWYDPTSHASLTCPVPGACNCATKLGGCAAGGFLGSACTVPGDGCEQRSGSSSHNGCVWNIAHGN